MKIRAGFVSNSSSSSFVVGLVKPIEQYTYEEFKEEYEITDDAHGKVLFQDLKSHEIEVDEDLVYAEIYESEVLSDEEKTELEDKIIRYGAELLAKKLEEKKNNCIYTVEYADDDGQFYCDMEHEFMPNFKATIKRISHH